MRNGPATWPNAPANLVKQGTKFTQILYGDYTQKNFAQCDKNKFVQGEERVKCRAVLHVKPFNEEFFI